nr:hypothetical protein [Salinigranum rubrum]
MFGLVDGADAFAGLEERLDLLAGDVGAFDVVSPSGESIETAGGDLEAEDEREEHALDDSDGTSHPQREAFGVGDTVRFGRYLAEEEDERAHAERRRDDG